MTSNSNLAQAIQTANETFGGARVNSKNATKFRRWATSILKQYLAKGYAVNQNITQQHYEELKNVVKLMSRTTRSATATSVSPTTLWWPLR